MTKKWILGLDSLRIILAVIVLLSHLDTYSLFHPTTNNSVKLIGFIVGNTFVGVCAVIAFFIVSGIVIHFPYTKEKKLHPFTFLVKRFLRIGIPMIVIYIIAKALSVPVSSLPFWSLYCEIIYYAVYPLIICLIKQNKKALCYLLILSFLASYIVVFAEGTAFKDLLDNNKNLNAEYWQFGLILTAILGLPNWLLGVFIAQKFTQLPNEIQVSTLKIQLSRAAIFSLSMICSILRYHAALSYTLTLNIFGLFAAYWIWLEINYWAKRPTKVFLEKMGKISYSVYICHAIVVFLVAGMQKKGVVTIFLDIILTFVFSYLFYLIIEKPSHKLAQKIN